MNSKHHADRRFSDYRPNTSTPLADSNQEDGWRGLERQKLMVVRMHGHDSDGRHSDGRHSDCGGGDEQYVE